MRQCAEQNVDVPVSQSVEQIVNVSMLQVVIAIVEIVGVPVLKFRKGEAGCGFQSRQSRKNSWR